MSYVALIGRLLLVPLLVTLATVAEPFTTYANAAPAAEECCPWGFPSFGSTVVGSVGFINDAEIGWFSSATRGDSVTQTFFGGPPIARRASLKIDVVENTLTNGAAVEWNFVVNGHVVGSFSVVQGFTGEMHEVFTFAKVRGPTFHVALVVTNDVPLGDGAHTLAYTEPYAHSLRLRRRP
jgi:hypothetical protein